MGGGGKGSSSSTVSIPPEVLARYNSVNSQAQSVAQTPFQQYSTDPNAFVAPLNSVQQSGINQVQQGANAAQPLYGAAEAMTALGSGNVNPQDLQIGKYMSPYLNSVLGSTVAAENLQNAQQSSGLKGQAIQQGAFGGDRADVAQANLAYQQDVANNQTNAGIMNTGFNTGLSAAEQQQGVGLQAGQANQQRILDAANQLGGLGAAQQNAALTGGAAQLAAGQTAQQTQQAGLTALYNQFLQQQAYPFQTTQFLANIAEGTGALSGNTTNTTMSDERLKENIQKIGKTNDGQTIYRYNYKGDDRVQIGLMAQDVEKKHPDAVGLAGGYKTVDYGKATDDAAERGNFRSGGAAEGGLVAPQHSYEGFADGGDAGGDAYLTELLNKLQSNQGMFYPGQGSARSGIGDTTGAYGSAMAEPQQHQMIQGTAAPPPQPSVMDNISSNVSKAKDLYNTGKDVLLGGDKSSGLIGHGGELDDSLSGGGKDGASLLGDASNFLSKEFASGGLVPRRHRDSGGGMPYSNQVGDTSKLDIPDQKSQNTLQTAGGPHGGGGGNMAGQIGSMALGLAGSAVGGPFGGMAGSMLGSFLKRGGTADRKNYDQGGIADYVPYPAGATYQLPVDDPNAPDPTEQELKRTDQQINAGLGYLGSGLASGVGLAKDVIKDIPNAYDTLANDAGAVWRKWTTPSDTSQKVTLPTAQSYSNATPPATLSLPNTDSTPSGHYEVRGRVSVWVPDSQKTGTFSHEGSGLSQPSISAPLDTHKAGNFPSTPDAPSAGLASGAPPAAAPAASSPPAAGGGDERRADQPTLGLVPSTQPNINDGQPPVDGNQKDGGGFWHDIGQGLRGAGDWLGRNQNWLVPVGEGLATAASTPTHNFWYAIAQGAGAGLNATQDIQNQMTQRDLVRADTNVSTQHGIGVGIKNYADLVNQWQQAQARGLNPPPLPEFATQHGYTGPMPTGPGLLARTKSAAPGPTEPGWKPAVGGGGTPDASELFNSGIVPTEGGTDPTTGAFRTSPKGAIGPSQAVPSTAADVAKELNIPFDEHRLKTDSEYNRQIGQRYYADQLKKYSDPLVAAAAYNAGPGRVDDAIKAAQADGTSYLSKLPAETQNYVSAFEARTSGIRQSRPTTAGATQQATISPTSTFGDDFDALRNDPTMASDPYRLQQFYSKWAPLATGESGDIITGAVKTAAGLLGENRTGTSVGANGLQPTAGAISTAILEGGAPGVSDRRNDFMKNYQTVNSNLQAQESQLNTLDEIYKNYNGNMLDRSKAQIEGVLTGFGIPVANYPALKAFIEGPNINPDATVKSQYDDAMKTVNMQVLQGLDNLPGGAPKSELEHLEAVAARPELDPIARHDLSARLHTLVQRQIDMNNSIAGEMKRSGTADPFNSDFANRPENSVDAYYKRNKLSITPYAGTPPAAASGQASPTNGSTERLPATVDNIGHSFQINGKTITVIGDGKGGATYGILHQ